MPLCAAGGRNGDDATTLRVVSEVLRPGDEAGVFDVFCEGNTEVVAFLVTSLVSFVSAVRSALFGERSGDRKGRVSFEVGASSLMRLVGCMSQALWHNRSYNIKRKKIAR